MVDTGGNGAEGPTGGRAMRIRGRGLLGALAVGVAAAAVVATAPAASTTARVHFPRDHFAHAGAGIEWWYATGLVRGSDGRRYTVFFTLFRRGGLVLPVSQVVDLGRDSIVGHSERLAPATLA